MNKYFLKNEGEFTEIKKLHPDLDTTASDYKAGPESYPCVAVISDKEIDFIYPTMVYFGYGALTIKEK